MKKIIRNNRLIAIAFFSVFSMGATTILHSENIRGEHFSKKFLLNTKELGDATLLFEISCRNTKRMVTYKIFTGARLVEGISIIEMK